MFVAFSSYGKREARVAGGSARARLAWPDEELRFCEKGDAN